MVAKPWGERAQKDTSNLLLNQIKWHVEIYDQKIGISENEFYAQLFNLIYTNWNLAYTTRQGSRVSCLAQTGFAAFFW